MKGLSRDRLNSEGMFCCTDLSFPLIICGFVGRLSFPPHVSICGTVIIIFLSGCFCNFSEMNSVFHVF